MHPDYKRLSIHHIGGRFGDGGFPIMRPFEKDIIRVIYDADSDCVDQIREKHKDSLSELHVLPYCVGEADRPGEFNINYDPTSSSIFSFNPDYRSFYFFLYNHDFIVSDSMRTVEKREVNIVTMDQIFKDEALKIAAPDFLSMDVQGAEYNILQGSKEILRQNVLALVIETWFHPLYQGQKIFGDISNFLSDHGFYFVKCLRMAEYSPFRAPVGQRGEGFQMLTDALFLRRIDSIESVITDNILLHTMLRKLAFISITYNQFEYGLKCLHRSKKANVSYETDFKNINYYKFLDDIEKSVEKMPLRYPKTFSEKYTFELSKRRFNSRSSLKGNKQKKTLRENIWLKFIYPNIYFFAEIYEFLIQKIWAGAASLILTNSPVEKVLVKYGLKRQAKLLKRNRVIQSLFSRR
ncbi:MAG: FkbM family methyltransferase [Nitrospirae bacterium]|nr:FkbM family methyltransferase [Nitrospirota bacterium]